MNDEEFEQECRAAHLRLWNWMGSHPFVKKEDWPEWEKLPPHLWAAWDTNQCFACLIAVERRRSQRTALCSQCPLSYDVCLYGAHSKLGQLKLQYYNPPQSQKRGGHLKWYQIKWRQYCKEIRDAWPERSVPNEES